jgi:hypothetical protein
MKNSIKPCLILLFVLMANLLIPPLLAIARAEDVVALVSRDMHLPALSLQDLKDIYQGNRKVWGNGKGIELFLPPEGSPAMEILVKKVFRKHSSSDLSKFYLRAIFKNKFSKPPKSYRSGLEALALIHRTPGGIAIVSTREFESDPLVRAIPILRTKEP